jgi:hypothetical protein
MFKVNQEQHLFFCEFPQLFMEVQRPLCPWLTISFPLIFLLVFFEAILDWSMICMVLEESISPYSQ